MSHCGAKTKSGNPCKKSGMANGRCRLHGGLSPGGKPGNKNALKHGIYSAGLDEEEACLWDEIKLGSVDEELKICRLRLRRALIAEKSITDNPGDINTEMEFSEHRVRSFADGEGNDGEELVKKRPDYRAIIDRLMGRIAQLEKTRKDLAGGSIDTDGTGVLRIPAKQTSTEWEKEAKSQQSKLLSRVSE